MASRPTKLSLDKTDSRSGVKTPLRKSVVLPGMESPAYRTKGKPQGLPPPIPVQAIIAGGGIPGLPYEKQASGVETPIPIQAIVAGDGIPGLPYEKPKGCGDEFPAYRPKSRRVEGDEAPTYRPEKRTSGVKTPIPLHAIIAGDRIPGLPFRNVSEPSVHQRLMCSSHRRALIPWGMLAANTWKLMRSLPRRTRGGHSSFERQMLSCWSRLCFTIGIRGDTSCMGSL